MPHPWTHPSSLYDLAQVFAGLIYSLGMYGLLRSHLSPVRITVLLASSLLLVVPFATQLSLRASGEDGRSYYGALLAQLVGIALYLRITRSPALLRTRIWNAFALVSGLVYAALRLGCHFRGCCWGRICPYPWATVYRSEAVVTPWLFLPLHPVQLYSVLHGLLTTAVLALYLRQRGLSQSQSSPTRGVGLFLILMGLGRLGTDLFRADAAFFQQAWGPFYPNTVLSVGVAVLGLVLFGRRRKQIPISENSSAST